MRLHQKLNYTFEETGIIHSSIWSKKVDFLKWGGSVINVILRFNTKSCKTLRAFDIDYIKYR